MKIDKTKLRFTTPEMIFMLENQAKLERCEDYLRQAFSDMEVVVKTLMQPEKMHQGFFVLGVMNAEMSAFIEKEFPEEEESDEDQEKCCKDLPY